MECDRMKYAAYLLLSWAWKHQHVQLMHRKTHVLLDVLDLLVNLRVIFNSSQKGEIILQFVLGKDQKYYTNKCSNFFLFLKPSLYYIKNTKYQVIKYDIMRFLNYISD